MIDAEEISEIWSPFLNYLIKLEKELKCFICNGLLRTPKLLPCNHIVCSDCIITPLTSERSVCLSCQNPFRYEDTRHAFHAERMVSLFQEMDAAIGSIIQQRPSPKNVPGDEQPGVHNAQDKASSSLLSKKCSLAGDAPPIHKAQNKPIHSQSHGFPSANYRTSKKRVFYEAMPNRIMNSEKVSGIIVPSNLKESSYCPSFGKTSGSKLHKHDSYANENLQVRITELESYEGLSSNFMQAEWAWLQKDLQLQSYRLSQLEEEKEAMGSQLEESQAQRASLEEALFGVWSAQQAIAAQLESTIVELFLRGKSIDRLEKALAQEKDSRARYETEEAARRVEYVNSDEFQVKLGPKFMDMLVFGAQGTIKQLRRGSYLKPDVIPPDAVDFQEIIDQIPDDFLVKFT